ncbi:MAG TPA: class II aldolase/adducin family protein, partial [Hyphomicrobiaceae bacterium]|nr:class II aldolase/adducin family protein [Hyphomicrobiaceae bacterium]
RIAIDTGAAVPAGMEREEWEARVLLAACYRVFAHLGWTEMIYNHITLRVPGPERHFLINPFGLHYTEVTASNLVKIDLDGNILSDSKWPINPAGLAPHASIHRGIDTAHCVMHTHTTAGLAVACTRGGLSMTNFYSAQLYGKVATHDFEGITVNPEEGPRMLKSLDGKPTMILRNHGLLAWGETLPQAFAHLWTIQRACEIQVAAQAMNTELIEIPQAVLEQCTRMSLQFDPKYGAGVDVFNALVRQIDRIDPSYKT